MRSKADQKIQSLQSDKSHRDKFAKETSERVGVEIVPVNSYQEPSPAVDHHLHTSTNSRTPFLGKWALGKGFISAHAARTNSDDEALLTSSRWCCTPMRRKQCHLVALAHFEREDFKLRDHPTTAASTGSRYRPCRIYWRAESRARIRQSDLRASVTTSAWERSSPAVGKKVYDAAKATGAGREVPLDWFTQDVILIPHNEFCISMKGPRAFNPTHAAFSAGIVSAAKISHGISSFSANQTPIWVAKEEGLFKRFGTDPDLILIEGGTRGAQALISGDLPIMGMSGQPVISARARGSDLT